MTESTHPRRLFVLGAPDPEMAAIERLADRHGHLVAYAAWRGRRVHAGVAYKADDVLDAVLDVSLTPPRGPVLVECGFVPAHPIHECAPTLVDHHNPGDPGFGAPPAEYWRASSLGQVCELLEIPDAEVTDGMRLAAAADHCLAAAYAGACPGVGFDALRTHRLKQRATWLATGPAAATERALHGIGEACKARGLRVPTTEGDIERVLEVAYEYTKEKLRDAPRVQLGLDHNWRREVIDLRDVGSLPELPEVLAQTGQCAIYRMVPRAGARDARVKVGIIGAGEGSVRGTAPIEAFLGGWASAQGLVDLYGDPVRGYAGGYESALD